jgi:putative ABC transport system permease protein
MQNLKIAFRQLLKDPGFTAVAVLTLALGIGASVAIFSVVNTVLLNPLPGPAPERLIQIAERNYTEGGFREQNRKPFFVGVSSPVLEALKANQGLFTGFAWADSMTLERKTEDFTEREYGYMVSPNFLSLWSVPPLLGRTFAKDEAVPINEEGKPMRDAAIVLSYTGWKSQFGGDTNVIGKVLELSGLHFTVIGVMPRQFQFPWGGTKFWLPAEPPGYGAGPNIRVFARLKPGVTYRQTEAMLATVAQRLTEEHGTDKFYGSEWSRRPGGLGLWVRPARYEVTEGQEDLQRTLFGLLAAIGFVLLIVCATVANLTLARTEKRQQELAIRAALGAGRLRLMRQLLTESVTLACAGGLCGIAVAAAGVRLLAGLVPEYLPRLKVIQIDSHALGFTLLLSVVTGLAFGCVPAWHAGRAKLSDALKQAGLSATAGAGRRLYRSALVVAEVALALVLLTGAGLMIESVVRLLHVNPGFDPQNLVQVTVQLPWDTYNDPEHDERARQLRSVLFAELHERLAALPGVKAVGIGKHGAWPEKLHLDGRDEPFEVLLDGCGVERSDLFRAMRIPLRAGRYFDQNDVGEGAGSTIINETLARTFWPGEDAVGKRFARATASGRHQYQVVGVVGDLRDYRYDQQLRPTFYRPLQELRLEGMAPFFVIRTDSTPRALLPAIRQLLHAAEPRMQPPQVFLSRQALYDATQAQRTYMLFLVVFASIGVGLAALGIYGVLAYSVTRRTREIGIRMAMGAERRHVLGMVMLEGGRLITLGLLVGLIAAFWLMRLIRSQLFAVSPTEPHVFIAVVFLLLTIASLACLIPARRAMRINPMEALRYE